MSATEYLESLMGKHVRITLSDGRIVTGSLECIDHACNLIVYNVEIFLSGSLVKISSVMVPGQHLAKLEIASLDI
jgi:small nuclear ribonucleoprotein (snRNP)-like protein